MPVDTSSYPRRSRFVYGASGSETDVTFALPPRGWGRRTPTVGGSRTSAAGVPASYVVRRDEVVVLPLRFRESEWESVRDLLVWGQAAESFDWYPDALDVGESFEVYLESPKAGQEIAPTRLPDYPKVLELTVELRLVTPAAFTPEFYADA